MHHRTLRGRLHTRRASFLFVEPSMITELVTVRKSHTTNNALDSFVTCEQENVSGRTRLAEVC